MEEIIQEYGGMFIGLIGGLIVIKIISELLFSGGRLIELLVQLGIMAC